MARARARRPVVLWKIVVALVLKCQERSNYVLLRAMACKPKYGIGFTIKNDFMPLRKVIIDIDMA